MRAGPPSPRAGNAGVIAAVAIAFAGVAVGALSSYIGGQGASAVASRPSPTPRAEPASGPTERDRIVARIVAGDIAPERLAPPSIAVSTVRSGAPRPKVAIIIDDMGIDRKASERALSLPGPLTYSFLPYARDVAEQTALARSLGAEIMLHLPMEPTGDADPGPHALKSGMTGAAFLRDLDWNLSRFDGYVGVNNHMGSRLTADPAAMKTVIANLDARGVFFLDSVTTSKSAARQAAAALGAEILSRDVFLDDRPHDPAEVRAQLAVMEAIARETGYAVAIGHPHKATLDVLGPWLTTAPARGFDLEFVSALKKQVIPVAAAETPPGLRG